MKIYAYDLQAGDIITSLVLDPAEDLVVDVVVSDEDNAIVKVEGYTKDTGEVFTFIWGDDKSLTIERGGR